MIKAESIKLLGENTRKSFLWFEVGDGEKFRDEL